MCRFVAAPSECGNVAAALAGTSALIVANKYDRSGAPAATRGGTPAAGTGVQAELGSLGVVACGDGTCDPGAHQARRT